MSRVFEILEFNWFKLTAVRWNGVSLPQPPSMSRRCDVGVDAIFRPGMYQTIQYTYYRSHEHGFMFTRLQIEVNSIILKG